MSHPPEPTKPWNPRDFAFYGGLLGLALGVIHAFGHAFWSQPSDDHPVEHLLWEMALSIVTGAALPAFVAVIRNWLMRDR
jgi:hypothetical protein